MYKSKISSVGDKRRLKVGLLGGSFNPPHQGHLHITIEAIKKLGLDEVWWLVSPLNPFKKNKKIPPVDIRVDEALNIINNPKIKVTDIETKLGTFLTADTLQKLSRLFPNVNFVWIIGDDLADELSKWYNWKKIFALVPIAVFSRKDYPWKTIKKKAFKTFEKNQVFGNNIRNLAKKKKPAWAYVRIRPNQMSSTLIRNTKENIYASAKNKEKSSSKK